MRARHAQATQLIPDVLRLCTLILLIVGVTTACGPSTLSGLVATTTKVVSEATASPTIWFEQTRETAEAGLIQTQLALVETITPIPPPTRINETRTPEPFVPGITAISYVPWGVPQALAITTQWRDLVNGERTYVYAGARVDTSTQITDISQGLVILNVNSTDLSNRVWTEYESPGKTGVLTIKAASGYRLTLAAADGATLYFDVPTGQFVGSLTATVAAPTMTPLPPRMSTPTALPLPTGYPNQTPTTITEPASQTAVAS